MKISIVSGGKYLEKEAARHNDIQALRCRQPALWGTARTGDQPTSCINLGHVFLLRLLSGGEQVLGVSKCWHGGQRDA